MTPIPLEPQPRILVIALRRLGDVLLTTPLIRSLRRAWPDAKIEALVFADTAGILEGNPDLDGVVTMPPRLSGAESLALAARLWRRYALAVSTQTGDRPSLFAWAAGRRRVGPVQRNFGGRVKRLGYHRAFEQAPGGHRVEEILRLADALGIPRMAEVVPPRPVSSPMVPDAAYAVIHAAPMFRYKQWTKEGWRALAQALAARGLTVVATGGPSAGERDYLDTVWDGIAVRRVDGRLTWPQLADLIAKARLYVGPDTSVTHLAAATGCPTLALFGPTDPRLWGPSPCGALDAMWDAARPLQRRGNVWLLIRLAENHFAAALLLPLYYLADATITLLRRFAQGEPVMLAHRSHFYQHALDNGFTVYQIVGRVFVLNLILASLAAATFADASIGVHLAALLAGCVLVGVLLWNFSRRRHSR
jgi:heptosyltransferase-3